MSEPVHIISLGAGVQSSTMALMAAWNKIKPMPEAAIFADTQAEPASVYVWLDWLEKQLPFPVYRVTKGDLTADTLRLRVRTKSVGGVYSRTNVPTYILNKDGTRGITMRQCTYDYKVLQIIREAKRIADGRKIVQWIGISRDEIRRMKPSRDSQISHRWPLVDLDMRRHDCINWMLSGGYPKPPRSACVYCPFHNNTEWRRLKDEEPKEWERAVKFEKDLQAVKAKTDNMSGIPFLHQSLIPLEKVDLTTEQERGQGDLFTNECEGACGV
jgi:hypothetical protein